MAKEITDILRDNFRQIVKSYNMKFNAKDLLPRTKYTDKLVMTSTPFAIISKILTHLEI